VTASEFRRVVAWANATGRASRRAGAPTLMIDSPRRDVLAWLAWHDPNGTFVDEDVRDGQDPHSHEDAWVMLQEVAAADDYGR